MEPLLYHNWCAREFTGILLKWLRTESLNPPVPNSGYPTQVTPRKSWYDLIIKRFRVRSLYLLTLSNVDFAKEYIACNVPALPNVHPARVRHR
ncbi:hypothetical protein BDM02DRAFT_2470918 [Thelephora ganbajun]|uniref:Uncharacterized protein n=1 Tax=Thelephora ganbajun TaxID=370292 RepID=A0ACB6YYM0_THEGA|nr:hypothetical protein BDM02DRAFT_2470918 [Thelephora ganbajun]